MIERILLAADDSPDSLAATRLAVQLAGELSAQLRAVHALADHDVDLALTTATGLPAVSRRGAAVTTLLARVASLARAAGVAVDTAVLPGGVATGILDAARTWPADLVIIGRSSRSATGEPYVGSLTRHVLEFADQPVLVVPAAGRRPAP
jgi:nucleotide-binding universal stress UspA family protein